MSAQPPDHRLRARATLYGRAVAAALRPVPPAERCREGACAQFGEDRILERIFDGRAHGFCVEVGAYDGTTGSATYLFERKGWYCLLVEPVPGLAEQIRRTRRGLVVNCAASGREGEATLYVAEQAEQMSTLELTPAHEAWIRRLGGAVRPIQVPTRTLDAILAGAEFPRIDFMTIDVEGHELAVLQGFSFARHRPRVVIIEENVLGRTPEVERHMAGHGYVNFRRTGVNDWYAHESDRDLVDPDAVRQFRLEKAMRLPVGKAKERVVRRMPAPVRERVTRSPRVA